MCDGELDGKEAEVCCGISLFCVIFTGAVLFGIAFDTLEPTQVGLRYDGFLVKIDESKVYASGRYFLGVGQSFVKYPTNLILLDFSSESRNPAICWSKEGQQLLLDVSLNYRLRRNHLVKIYHRYKDHYNYRLKLIALEAVKQVTTKYEATEFFNKRTQISNDMKAELEARFDEDFADVELFALRKIDVPDGFDRKIVDKVVKAQEYQTALNMQDITEIRASNDVIRGKGDALINETLANANASATLITSNALSSALRSLRHAEATAYQELQAALSLTGADLLRFRWAQLTDKLQSKDDSSVSYIVGFDAPTITVSGG